METWSVTVPIPIGWRVVPPIPWMLRVISWGLNILSSEKLDLSAKVCWEQPVSRSIIDIISRPLRSAMRASWRKITLHLGRAFRAIRFQSNDRIEQIGLPMGVDTSEQILRRCRQVSGMILRQCVRRRIWYMQKMVIPSTAIRILSAHRDSTSALLVRRFWLCQADLYRCCCSRKFRASAGWGIDGFE